MDEIGEATQGFEPGKKLGIERAVAVFLALLHAVHGVRELVG